MKTQKNHLQALREALNQSFKERESVIDGMLVALLSREMLFLLGPPGTAKSAVCEALCSALSGKYFSWLISKFTTPEEIFGSPSMMGLKEGRYERVVDGLLPTADVAFLDEIFKGSSAILNTLLPIINERTFHNAGKAGKIPLQVLFGASNEIPAAEELSALYDRFALRYVVDYLQNDASMEDLIQNGLILNIPPLPLAELEKEQKAAAQVAIKAPMIKIMIELRRAVRSEGLRVSDRKWVQIVRILKATAHLNGHSEVMEDDLDILENVLWETPDQQRTVRKLIGKFSNPIGEQIMMIMDAVSEVWDNLEKNTMQPVEGHKKVKDAKNALKALQKDHPQNKKLLDAIEKVEKINLKIVKEKLGVTL